jgi:hypothetical protein
MFASSGDAGRDFRRAWNLRRVILCKENRGEPKYTCGHSGASVRFTAGEINHDKRLLLDSRI